MLLSSGCRGTELVYWCGRFDAVAAESDAAELTLPVLVEDMLRPGTSTPGTLRVARESGAGWSLARANSIEADHCLTGELTVASGSLSLSTLTMLGSIGVEACSARSIRT